MHYSPTHWQKAKNRKAQHDMSIDNPFLFHLLVAWVAKKKEKLVEDKGFFLLAWLYQNSITKKNFFFFFWISGKNGYYVYTVKVAD